MNWREEADKERGGGKRKKKALRGSEQRAGNRELGQCIARAHGSFAATASRRLVPRIYATLKAYGGLPLVGLDCYICALQSFLIQFDVKMQKSCAFQ